MKFKIRTLVSLIVLNLVIRGLWLAAMHPPQLLDFEWYYTHALSMYHGHGYRWYGHYTTYWPIGYPYFLSILFRVVGPSVWAGLMANVILSTLIVVFVYLLTLKISERPLVALAAALGYSLLPSQIEWNSVLGSEELYTLLLMASLYLYVGAVSDNRSFQRLLSGLALGLACDVRPIGLLFPAVIFMYEIGLRKMGWRGALTSSVLFAVGMAMAVLPVTVRNYIAIHHFVLVSTNGGVNLWQGTKADGAYYWSWNPKVNPLLPYLKNDYVENKVAMKVATHYILTHPWHTLVHGFAKIFFLYWVDWNVVSVTLAAAKMSQSVIRVMMWFDNLVYYLWMGVAFFGVRQFWQRRHEYKLAVLPLMYVAYNTAIFFFFPAWDRFRYPMMPLYAVLFGIGCVWVGRRVRLL
jgi:4-amino-4-deoxy-L-arabinose transferase-like glycosyltransferase